MKLTGHTHSPPHKALPEAGRIVAISTWDLVSPKKTRWLAPKVPGKIRVFPKMVGFPNKPMGFPTKNDHFGVFWGHHHLRKQPYNFIISVENNGMSVKMDCIFFCDSALSNLWFLVHFHDSGWRSQPNSLCNTIAAESLLSSWDDLGCPVFGHIVVHLWSVEHVELSPGKFSTNISGCKTPRAVRGYEKHWLKMVDVPFSYLFTGKELDFRNCRAAVHTWLFWDISWKNCQSFVTSSPANAVDGRNPAPCTKPCKSWGKTTQQLVQDVFHQQYLYLSSFQKSLVIRFRDVDHFFLSGGWIEHSHLFSQNTVGPLNPFVSLETKKKPDSIKSSNVWI